jgi:hypothetical protein
MTYLVKAVFHAIIDADKVEVGSVMLEVCNDLASASYCHAYYQSDIKCLPNIAQEFKRRLDWRLCTEIYTSITSLPI